MTSLSKNIESTLTPPEVIFHVLIMPMERLWSMKIIAQRPIDAEFLLEGIVMRRILL